MSEMLQNLLHPDQVEKASDAAKIRRRIEKFLSTRCVKASEAYDYAPDSYTIHTTFADFISCLSMYEIFQEPHRLCTRDQMLNHPDELYDWALHIQDMEYYILCSEKKDRTSVISALEVSLSDWFETLHSSDMQQILMSLSIEKWKSAIDPNTTTVCEAIRKLFSRQRRIWIPGNQNPNVYTSNIIYAYQEAHVLLVVPLVNAYPSLVNNMSDFNSRNMEDETDESSFAGLLRRLEET